METPVQTPALCVAAPVVDLRCYDGLLEQATMAALSVGGGMKTLTAADLERAVHTGLKDLRLPAIRACYQQKADLARRESMSFERFLLELIEQEQRHSNRIHRWLHQSRLPLQKTLDTFDRGRLPVRIDHHLSVLLEGGFLESRQNVLAFGPPGSGKTHLLCALGRELIFQRRRQYNCSTLVQEMLRAERELRLLQLLKRLLRYQALTTRPKFTIVLHNRLQSRDLKIVLAQQMAAK